MTMPRSLCILWINLGYKVIILDVKQLSSLTLLGIASVVIALSVGYYLLKQSHQSDPLEIKKSD